MLMLWIEFRVYEKEMLMKKPNILLITCDQMQAFCITQILVGKRKISRAGLSLVNIEHKGLYLAV